ncbi:porin family protein [Paraflavitalea pollutisoli]|uniref:porin family protein n=1 Tax=Paraflavitalea pollutisoli TaxID=3034143 RepID=UPI0023EC0A84|nr:porin family protein [Paraflavitalea sp. H1-2-19X]
MLKVFCILCLLMMMHRAARSQVLIALLFGDKLNSGKLEFGLTVGPSLTNISGIDGKAKAGLNLGLYFNIRLSDRWFIHPEGVAKGGFGARKIPPYGTGNDSLDQFFQGGDIKRKIGSLSLPVLMHYRIKGKWFAELGPQVNLLVQPKDIFNGKVNDNDLTYTTDIRDDITLLDIGMAAGVLYRLREVRGMGVGIRYYAGLTDVQKNTVGSQRNSMWQFNVTIPIGTGKPRPPSPTPSTSTN